MSYFRDDMKEREAFLLWWNLLGSPDLTAEEKAAVHAEYCAKTEMFQENTLAEAERRERNIPEGYSYMIMTE